MTKDTPDLQLDTETSAELDEILRAIENHGQNTHCGFVIKEPFMSPTTAKAAIARLLIRSQTNAVAWTVGILDDLHINAEGHDPDRAFKGAKNTIRDRYKAEVGVDPAPGYPVKAKLQAQLEKEEHEY